MNPVSHSQPRVLVLGAHPDDAEYHSGGFLSRLARHQATIKLISVTDGRSGHFETPPDQLVPIRRQEAAAAGAVIGCEYVTWDFPDGSLMPSLDLRHAIIREIREFKPDLVLTHRTIDYHPDHRAVGQAVQDASYLVTVPHVVPDVPRLTTDPIVAFMPDLFTRPAPLRKDVVIDVTSEFERAVDMMDCHVSQFYQWLPFHDGILDQVPSSPQERRNWLRQWFGQLARRRAKTFAVNLPSSAIGKGLRLDDGHPFHLIEAYEISEYARQPSLNELSHLFHSAHISYGQGE